MSRAASGQHPLSLDFYHTFVLHLPCCYHVSPCFHHTSTAFLPHFYQASTMLQPFFYLASTGVYLLGNQWCSPWSLSWSVTWHLPASPHPPWGPSSQYHSSFNADGEINTCTFCWLHPVIFISPYTTSSSLIPHGAGAPVPLFFQCKRGDQHTCKEELKSKWYDLYHFLPILCT